MPNEASLVLHGRPRPRLPRLVAARCALAVVLTVGCGAAEEEPGVAAVESTESSPGGAGSDGTGEPDPGGADPEDVEPEDVEPEDAEPEGAEPEVDEPDVIEPGTTPVECPPEAGGGYATCSVPGQVCRRDNEGRDMGATTCRCGDHDGNGTPFWQCSTPIH